jgi:prevent-host-death family protein
MSATRRWPPRASNVWTIEEAQEHFEEVFARAFQDGPQLLVEHGKPLAYLASKEDGDEDRRASRSCTRNRRTTMAIRKPTEWTLEEARRHLHAVIVEASEAGPQPVEHANAGEAIIVPAKEWINSGRLADFFLNSPLRGSGIVLERAPDTVDDFTGWMERRGTFDDLERLADSLASREDESR